VKPQSPTEAAGAIFRLLSYPEARPCLVVSEPGNGTRYEVSFLPLSSSSCEQLHAQAGSTLVSWVSGGCYPFAPKGYLTASYVQEKLGGSEGDAEWLVKLIGEFLDRPYKGRPRRIAPKLPAPKPLLRLV
jgi:hypothetical protein